ncbi:hypothetical protein X559_0474 [Paenilisteria newyorkensis]|nr:hypothetical protein X559_0474 [Listeria newyorkensis]
MEETFRAMCQPLEKAYEKDSVIGLMDNRKRLKKSQTSTDT